MEKEDYGHTKLERLERLLKSPDTVSPEELESWMQDVEFLNFYRIAMDARRSLLEKGPLPDVKEAYRLFRHKRMQPATPPVHAGFRRKGYKWAAVASAACLLLCLLFFVGKKWSSAPENIQVYVAQTHAGEVILSVGDESIPLTESADSLVSSLSLKLNIDRELRYDEEQTEKETAVPPLHVLATPQGKDFHLVLSDGTRVWLNAESRLTYPRTFAGDTRTVQLQGEAYFEVSKDKAHPFVVECGALKTTVLGTSFNVKCYQQEEPHVTLAEGSVQVTHRQQGLTLKPGQDATFNADGELVSREVDVQSFICWKDGSFYFDGVTFKQMMVDLGRWYKMDVVFAQSRHLGDSLHLHAERAWNISEIVQQINQISDAQVRIEGNTLIVE